MTQEKIEKHEHSYYEDHVATQKDLKILALELDGKMLNMKMEINHGISSLTAKLGTLIVACSGILFGLLSYFHK